MKIIIKILLFSLILGNVTLMGFSQANYGNGNGTIIETLVDGNVQLVLRRHIQHVRAVDYPGYKHYPFKIYSSPSLNKNNVVSDEEPMFPIDIFQIAEVTIEEKYSYWLNIKTADNIIGWVYAGEVNGWIPSGELDANYARQWIPYFNNRWEILNMIDTGNRVWTVRKLLSQYVSAWVVLDIRDKPGLVNTNVISQIVPPDRNDPLFFLSITEVTDEYETIDERTDRWLKINHNGVEGWIFGGYVAVERGGPKYFTPDEIILCRLGPP
ncbi:MAG: SH3 domain-containing protein [Treponema sp.]|nr:SH3 domain-containing protein [Treponema sp.]